MSWHSKPYQELLEHFKVDPKKGVPVEEVPRRKKKYGKNSIIAQKAKPGWLLLAEQFNNPVIIILIISTIFTLIVGDYKDSIVIGVVIILNTVIGYFQERRAAEALKSLSKMTAPTAVVIRDGEKQSIRTSQVVCGDIILLESGMRAPADARLIDTQNLIVDESMLTGESFPVTKKHNLILDESAPLGDRLTMIYSGTIIQKGRATAIVSDVGYKTEFGKISQRVLEAEEKESPLQANISKFGKWLSFVIIAIIVIIFIVGYLRGNDYLTMFLTSVGLAVSAIPEGLPVAVTITLSIGVYQMAKHRAVVKKLAAVETLGSTNIICTDKTGTLTKNQMTTTRLYAGGKGYEVTGSGYLKEGKVLMPGSGKEIYAEDLPALNYTAMIGSLCTESTLADNGKDWKITGDPTEGALMIASDKLGFSRDKWIVNVEIPFESENQFMAVKANNGNSSYILAKGAPEAIINRCEAMIDEDGTNIEIDHDRLNDEIIKFSDEGLRILALAYSKDKHNDINIDNLGGLIFIGFAGIKDAIRPEAVKAVRESNNAGVRVVMITGDHVKTAQTVAKSVGIAEQKDKPAAIDGRELDKISDEELFSRVPDIDVYARVAPDHKFRIVKQLQKHDNVVAMTGDGVNDAPALKQADIGVAMGSGTDVAKEASHMVLMDDNFATIVRAIRRGRVILHNLQHILLYILATSLGGLLTIAMSVAVGFPLPVLPAQLLWINLVTDGTSTFPLAFEKEHGNVMKFSPRRRKAPLVSMQMIRRMIVAGILMMVGTLGVFYFYIPESISDIFNVAHNDLGLLKPRTMAFCVLAFFQIWNVQNSRSIDRSLFFNLPHPMKFDPGISKKEKFVRTGLMKNPILLGVMLLAIVLQISAVMLPFMNTIFDTVPLNVEEWGIVFGISFSIIIVVEICKFLSAIFCTKRAEKRHLRNY